MLILEPLLARMVILEAVKNGWLDYPDNLQYLCNARYKAGFDNPGPVYNILCSRYNRWLVSKIWGWVNLPPVSSDTVPLAHVWVDEKDVFVRDPTVGFKGVNWYCLGFKLHRLKFEYVETDVGLWRGYDLAPDGIYARSSMGDLIPLEFMLSTCPWQAVRVVADLVALNWGSIPIYTTRTRHRAIEYQVVRDLVDSILQACIIPLQPPDVYTLNILEYRLQGYINELVSATLNPLNTYRLRREHIVTTYWLSRLLAESNEWWFDRLLADVYGLSSFRLDFRKLAPVYIF